VAEQKMVTLTIEGRPVTVAEGTTILEAAKTVGVLIPHYCYHPGLPVAGVCRMCLVEVEKAPKLAPSCATTVAEGQVVHVHSDKSLDARKGVLEMLLINHPLDCPICDQSGECELQDYTYQEGREDSRYREPKRFNPAEDFGGDVIYVPNRCILCTRCVRFMDDVAHEPTLNVSERGDRALIGKFEGRDMTHPWAANVIDLCPVGALLSKDFLNKARAWELDRTSSICPNCTQGCNVIMETRENQIVRMRPRANENVNAFFMCDWGRLNYRWMNEKSRVEQPMVRTGNTGLTATTWEAAITAAARALNGKKVFVAASPMLSNESLFLLTQLMQGGSGAFRVAEGDEAPLPGVEDLALRRERAANVYGAETLGFRKTKDLLGGLGQGDVLVIAGEDLEGVDASAISRAGDVIVIGSVMPSGVDRASVILPIANFSEEEGTVTNLRGRVQRFTQARQAPGETRPSWLVLGDLLGAMGKQSNFFLPSEVFARLASSHKSFAGLSYDRIGFKGLPVVDAPQTGPKAPIAVGAA
jgi:NADH-quinone oxidoreductase subunit G